MPMQRIDPYIGVLRMPMQRRTLQELFVDFQYESITSHPGRMLDYVRECIIDDAEAMSTLELEDFLIEHEVIEEEV
jgi:hypothetical protein